MYADRAEFSVDEIFHAWFRHGDPPWDNARRSTFGPAPGFVTGGPNARYCEGLTGQACATSMVREQPPAKVYLDSNTGWERTNPFDKSWEFSQPNAQ
jgi:endoglucanase